MGLVEGDMTIIAIASNQREEQEGRNIINNNNYINNLRNSNDGTGTILMMIATT